MKRTVVLVSFMATNILLSRPVFAETTASSDIIVTVGPTISLELSAEDFLINGITAGILTQSEAVTATAWTNSDYGFTLSVAAGDGEDYVTNDLIHETAISKFSSLATAGTFSSSDFTTDSWGVSLDSGTTYYGVPYYENGTRSIYSSSTSGTDEIDILTAAKAGTTMSAGDYQNILIFTVIANVE